RRGQGPGRGGDDRAQFGGGGLVGGGGGQVHGQAHERAEHPRLPGGLVRAHLAQLGGTVRREHQQRDARVVGLHHRGVQVRGRGAGGGDDGGGMRRVVAADPERGERRGALVDAHVGADPLPRLGGG